MVFKNHLFVIMLIRLKFFYFNSGPFVRQSDNGSPSVVRNNSGNGMPNILAIILGKINVFENDPIKFC